ncbi:MAG: hypothetical protein AAF773_27000 [Cyanobacteria bacterium P01_D01_bin.115]
MNNHHYTRRTRVILWCCLKLDRLAHWLSHEGPVVDFLWRFISPDEGLG